MIREESSSPTQLCHTIDPYRKCNHEGGFFILVVNLYTENHQLFASIQTSESQFGAIRYCCQTPSGGVVLRECQWKILKSILHCALFVINVMICLCAAQIIATFGQSRLVDIALGYDAFLNLTKSYLKSLSRSLGRNAKQNPQQKQRDGLCVCTSQSTLALQRCR